MPGNFDTIINSSEFKKIIELCENKLLATKENQGKFPSDVYQSSCKKNNALNKSSSPQPTNYCNEEFDLISQIDTWIDLFEKISKEIPEISALCSLIKEQGFLAEYANWHGKDNEYVLHEFSKLAESLPKLKKEKIKLQLLLLSVVGTHYPKDKDYINKVVDPILDKFVYEDLEPDLLIESYAGLQKLADSITKESSRNLLYFLAAKVALKEKNKGRGYAIEYLNKINWKNFDTKLIEKINLTESQLFALLEKAVEVRNQSGVTGFVRGYGNFVKGKAGGTANATTKHASLFEELLKNSSYLYELYFQLAMQYTTSNKKEKAQKILIELISTVPQNYHNIDQLRYLCALNECSDPELDSIAEHEDLVGLMELVQLQSVQHYQLAHLSKINPASVKELVPPVSLKWLNSLFSFYLGHKFPEKNQQDNGTESSEELVSPFNYKLLLDQLNNACMSFIGATEEIFKITDITDLRLPAAKKSLAVSEDIIEFYSRLLECPEPLEEEIYDKIFAGLGYLYENIKNLLDKNSLGTIKNGILFFKVDEGQTFSDYLNSVLKSIMAIYLSLFKHSNEKISGRAGLILGCISLQNLDFSQPVEQKNVNRTFTAFSDLKPNFYPVLEQWYAASPVQFTGESLNKLILAANKLKHLEKGFNVIANIGQLKWTDTKTQVSLSFLDVFNTIQRIVGSSGNLQQHEKAIISVYEAYIKALHKQGLNLFNIIEAFKNSKNGLSAHSTYIEEALNRLLPNLDLKAAKEFLTAMVNNTNDPQVLFYEAERFSDEALVEPVIKWLKADKEGLFGFIAQCRSSSYRLKLMTVVLSCQHNNSLEEQFWLIDIYLNQASSDELQIGRILEKLANLKLYKLLAYAFDKVFNLCCQQNVELSEQAVLAVVKSLSSESLLIWGHISQLVKEYRSNTVILQTLLSLGKDHTSDNQSPKIRLDFYKTILGAFLFVDQSHLPVIANTAIAALIVEDLKNDKSGQLKEAFVDVLLENPSSFSYLGYEILALIEQQLLKKLNSSVGQDKKQTYTAEQNNLMVAMGSSISQLTLVESNQELLKKAGINFQANIHDQLMLRVIACPAVQALKDKKEIVDLVISDFNKYKNSLSRNFAIEVLKNYEIPSGNLEEWIEKLGTNSDSSVDDLITLTKESNSNRLNLLRYIFSSDKCLLTDIQLGQLVYFCVINKLITTTEFEQLLEKTNPKLSILIFSGLYNARYPSNPFGNSSVVVPQEFVEFYGRYLSTIFYSEDSQFCTLKENFQFDRFIKLKEDIAESIVSSWEKIKDVQMAEKLASGVDTFVLVQIVSRKNLTLNNKNIELIKYVLSERLYGLSSTDVKKICLLLSQHENGEEILKVCIMRAIIICNNSGVSIDVDNLFEMVKHLPFEQKIALIFNDEFVAKYKSGLLVTSRLALKFILENIDSVENGKLAQLVQVGQYLSLADFVSLFLIAKEAPSNQNNLLQSFIYEYFNNLLKSNKFGNPPHSFIKQNLQNNTGRLMAQYMLLNYPMPFSEYIEEFLGCIAADTGTDRFLSVIEAVFGHNPDYYENIYDVIFRNFDLIFKSSDKDYTKEQRPLIAGLLQKRILTREDFLARLTEQQLIKIFNLSAGLQLSLKGVYQFAETEIVSSATKHKDAEQQTEAELGPLPIRLTNALLLTPSIGNDYLLEHVLDKSKLTMRARKEVLAKRFTDQLSLPEHDLQLFQKMRALQQGAGKGRKGQDESSKAQTHITETVRQMGKDQVDAMFGKFVDVTNTRLDNSDVSFEEKVADIKFLEKFSTEHNIEATDVLPKMENMLKKPKCLEQIKLCLENSSQQEAGKEEELAQTAATFAHAEIVKWLKPSSGERRIPGEPGIFKKLGDAINALPEGDNDAKDNFIAVVSSVSSRASRSELGLFQKAFISLSCFYYGFLSAKKSATRSAPGDSTRTTIGALDKFKSTTKLEKENSQNVIPGQTSSKYSKRSSVDYSATSFLSSSGSPVSVNSKKNEQQKNKKPEEPKTANPVPIRFSS